MSAESSSAFNMLDSSIQRWVWKQGWTELRDLQERAIPAVLAGDRDIVLGAPTASGKTEAVFLPIFSRLASENPIELGFSVLYVSPLKALINDQFDRLRLMGDSCGVLVHRWHGDVPQSRKAAALRKPSGVLIITPESLEALFVRRGLQIPTLFGSLMFVVVDELHAFIGTERGRQLQSLLNRIDLATRTSRPRYALSATLGDMRMAAEALRPGGGEEALIIESNTGGAEVRLQLRGYVEERPREGVDSPLDAIAAHLYKHLRGKDNLVFANSRGLVEVLADRLRQICENARVPVEFKPHHGNLSKEFREQLEAELKKGSPATAICTSTLELGIDIGSVHSIAQVGSPPSVASLRQRLGRSGRREGEPAILRIYIIEPAIDHDARPDEALRLQLIQSISTIELLLAYWCEPPRSEALHLSTLVQQVLSVIARHGGVHADQLFSVLCAEGPFRTVNSRMFAKLLRQLGKENVLQQSTEDGLLLLGPKGEQVIDHYTFYAAFNTQEEFRLIHAGKALGTLPIEYAVAPGMHLVFAGKRWKVVDVNAREKRINVLPSPAGAPPRFGGGGRLVHERVVRMMFEIYQSEDIPAYLDPPACELLREGRRQFSELGLRTKWLIESGSQTLFFPWLGSTALSALALALVQSGLEVDPYDFHLVVSGESEQVKESLDTLADTPAPAPIELARHAAGKEIEKHHMWLDDELLSADYASSRLDIEGAWARLQHIRLGDLPLATFSDSRGG